jgi:hypothetical protein
MAPWFDPTPLRGYAIRGIVGATLFALDTGAASRAGGSFAGRLSRNSD